MVSDDTEYTLNFIYSTGMPFLMKKQRHYEIWGTDIAASIATSLNLSAPFMSTGIINVDKILEVANLHLHVQFKLLISHICLNVLTNIQRIKETNWRGAHLNVTLLEDLFQEMKIEMFKVFKEVKEISEEEVFWFDEK